MKYLVLSGVSSAFLVFGMALIYAELGTLEFSRMYLPELTPTLIAGMLLIVSALAFKPSLAPFHLWTADVYQGAPAPVTALLATVSKGAVFALLFRYGLAGGLSWHRTILDVLMLLAAASILVGNLSALRQNNLKRMLAYSSIAHMGYLMITLVVAGRIDARFAVESMSFYLVAYFITTLAAFGVMTVLSPAERDAELLDDYTGLFWTRPGLAGLLTLAMLSLAGIPLTAGFIGKFYLFTAGSQGSLWVLLILLIIGSGLGLYYYVRVIFQMSVTPGTVTHDAARSPPAAPWGASVTLAVLGILLIGMGIAPAPFIDFLSPVSHSGSAEPRVTTR
jgi:NADH-quinone oxidoreductase subunit N